MEKLETIYNVNLPAYPAMNLTQLYCVKLDTERMAESAGIEEEWKPNQ
jgi:hypothetical protein